MAIILFDTTLRKRLFPLTETRAVADLRMGILTMKERWEKMTGKQVFVLTEQYLQSLYQPIPENNYLFVDATVIPSKDLVEGILQMSENASISDENGLIACKNSFFPPLSIHNLPSLFQNASLIPPVKRLLYPYQIFLWNEEMIKSDYDLLTKGRTSQKLNDMVSIVNASGVFIEEGAQLNFSILNASLGPIYIGKNSNIMEGCLVRGPFALGENSVLKMGSKIYGATTIGPYCIGGGEIKNSVITGYSNKAHDGYLGDSVIGEWCNLGAGTSNSNLKNTGGEVKLWNYHDNDYVSAGNKCGVIMGDYSRTAINTPINTGTVVGVSCNVFGSGLTPKVIRNFAWGVEESNGYKFERALSDIANWKKMKNKTVSEPETNILKHIFENPNN